MALHGDPVRVLVIPGLHDSGPTHWQSWLQRGCPHSVRVQQDDWSVPDLQRWADRIGETLAAQSPARWIAVAHSFGCLALMRHLATRSAGPEPALGVCSALLVAPADPDKFGVAPLLSTHRLGIDNVLIASETDPWMSFGKAAGWARHWGSTLINLGDAGHINVDSGHGALPVAMAVVRQMTDRTRRAETSARDAAADVALEGADEFGLVADQLLHHVAH